MPLERYRALRDFVLTPEPEGGEASTGGLRFSVQMHDATRLHWDLRLEWEGVLLSWAVTRGPSLDPGQKRLAVRTEDHPRDYLTFEGTIPAKNYGAGTVMLWDLGWWRPLVDAGEGLAKGLLKLEILGRRMTGAWMLVRMKPEGRRENWLLVKEHDAAEGAADALAGQRTSVATGRDLAGIAAEAPAVAVQQGRRPGFATPELATLVSEPPDGGGWQVEPKHDGYRALVALGAGGPRVYTRGGHDWTERFAALVPWLADLPCESALIDGEVVAGLGPESFGALQGALKTGGPLALYAFDLLHLDGVDLAPRPLADRRRALGTLFAAVPPRSALRLSPALEGQATAALAAICDAGGEGIVLKRLDAPHRGRRTRSWLKVKCGARSEFVVVGWSPSSSKRRPFASLLMATREGGTLTYRGRVGTGFDDGAMTELATLMEPLRGKMPFEARPADVGRGAVWLEPRLVAEVSHAGLTDEGRIRHGVFLGLRDDKPARHVRIERAAPAGPKVAGVALSHPARVIFPDCGVTKRDLADYYAAVAPAFFAEAAGRPVSLVRHPSGIAAHGFFQRHAGDGFPDAIATVPIAEKDGTVERYIMLRDAASLAAAVQIGAIEIHLWGARADRIERPDRLVFDLDPDEGLGFAEVLSAAADIRDHLAGFGIASAPMVTGGKGVHVVAHLRRAATWDTVKGFARTFAAALAEREPRRFTAVMAKARRRDRIFVDWLRNERGATAIAPFSVRARPGARVAIPVAWDELARLGGADTFGLDAATERAATPPAAPKPATLGHAAIAALERWIASGS